MCQSTTCCMSVTFQMEVEFGFQLLCLGAPKATSVGKKVEDDGSTAVEVVAIGDAAEGFHRM